MQMNIGNQEGLGLDPFAPVPEPEPEKPLMSRFNIIIASIILVLLIIILGIIIFNLVRTPAQEIVEVPVEENNRQLLNLPQSDPASQLQSLPPTQGSPGPIVLSPSQDIPSPSTTASAQENIAKELFGNLPGVDKTAIPDIDEELYATKLLEVNEAKENITLLPGESASDKLSEISTPSSGTNTVTPSPNQSTVDIFDLLLQRLRQVCPNNSDAELMNYFVAAHQTIVSAGYPVSLNVAAQLIVGSFPEDFVGEFDCAQLFAALLTYIAQSL